MIKATNEYVLVLMDALTPTHATSMECGCDDGRAPIPVVDVSACNYDNTAGCDDGSCVYGGRIDPSAYNDEAAGCDDGRYLRDARWTL